jgi:hypothetical protein
LPKITFSPDSQSAQAVLRNYRLGTSANLKKIKAALLSKEIIDIQGKTIELLDPVFKLWLREDYF